MGLNYIESMKCANKTVTQLRLEADELISSSLAFVRLANADDAEAQRLIASRKSYRDSSKMYEKEAIRLRELANKLERHFK